MPDEQSPAPNGAPAAGQTTPAIPIVDPVLRVVHIEGTFEDGTRVIDVPWAKWKILTAQMMQMEAQFELQQQAQTPSSIVRAPSTSIIPERHPPEVPESLA